MRKIEIITPQNVPVQFQLANVRERALAFFFDAMIQFFVTIFLYLALMGNTIESRTSLLVFYCIIMPFFVFYSLFFEMVMNGRTPGKAVLKIRVVKLSGSDLQLSDYLLRWLFRWLDIWMSLGSLAALQVSSSPKGQRTGDILADTTVVRLHHDFSVKLSDLLAIRSTQEHEVQFLGAIHFKEEEMLLVKQVMDRYKRYENDAYRQLIKETAHKVAERMGLDKYPGAADDFLRKVLVDYVTLTRS